MQKSLNKTNNKALKQKILKSIPSITIIYFFCMIVLGISWVGFWTDALCSAILIYFSCKAVKILKNGALKVVVSILNLLYIPLFLLWLLAVSMSNPSLDENYYYIKVDGRLFNAYVSTRSLPTRDSLKISETSIFCPVLEIKQFYTARFLDFEVIKSDGYESDKIPTLKRYIQSEVIDKGK